MMRFWIRVWNWLCRSNTRDRHIFVYSVGGETRHADPLEIDKLLVRHGGDDWGKLIDTVAKLKQPLDSVAEMAMGVDAIKDRKDRFDILVGKLVELSRSVFDLPVLAQNGSGFSSIEAISVMTQYVNFVAKLTEDARPKPHSPG
jgi:hypothetical protein